MLRRPKSRRALKVILTIMDADLQDQDHQVLESVETFKPENAMSSNDSISKLLKCFTKGQLLEYVLQRDPAAKRSWTKAKLAHHIVTNVWKFDSSASSFATQILSKASIPLSRQEMFFLLSQHGYLLRFAKSMVSAVDFDAEKQELVLLGTEYQIENARINLTARFERAYREEFDLTSIQHLYREKHGRFTFEELGKLIEVYFHHLNGNKYELSALNPNQVKRIKRLLVWHLDYNLHRRNFLHLPSLEQLALSTLLPYLNSYGMPWKSRSKCHFQLVDEMSVGEPSTSLKKELQKFSETNLATLDLDEDTSSAPVAKETFDLLESLGLLKDDLASTDSNGQSEVATMDAQFEGQNETEEQKIAGKETPATTVPAAPLLSNAQKDAIYNELVDFSYRKSLNGVSQSEREDPIFTVTLGRVLFEGKKEGGLLPKAPEKNTLSEAYDFNTNVPLAYDHILANAITNSELGSEDVDPHLYSLQFKFLPSPYGVEGEQLEEQLKYPPIEMWVQLNERSVPDLETLQIVTVEGENNSYVCLPAAKTDLKVSCQITGRILHDKVETAESAEEEPDAEQISSLLSATSAKYPRLTGQEGIQEFLTALRLDFSGRAPTSIAPYVEVVIDGKRVQYCFVSLSYRRELTIETEDDKTVQLTVVDGGLLGGKRMELRFVGDYTAGMDRANFDELLDYSTSFIKDL